MDITPAYGSPWLIAVNHVLHRLPVPRHSPCALCSLTSQRLRSHGAPLCDPLEICLSYLTLFENIVITLFTLIYAAFKTVVINGYLSFAFHLCSVFKVRTEFLIKSGFQYLIS